MASQVVDDIQVIQASFEVCKDYVTNRLAKVLVSLYKNGQNISDGRSFDRDGGMLNYHVADYSCFDRIRIETFPGSYLLRKACSVENVLKRVSFYSLFDIVTVYQLKYNFTIQLSVFSLKERCIDINVAPDTYNVRIILGRSLRDTRTPEVTKPALSDPLGDPIEAYDTCERYEISQFQ